jgi:hypothetical protein
MELDDEIQLTRPRRRLLWDEEVFLPGWFNFMASVLPPVGGTMRLFLSENEVVRGFDLPGAQAFLSVEDLFTRVWKFTPQCAEYLTDQLFANTSAVDKVLFAPDIRCAYVRAVVIRAQWLPVIVNNTLSIVEMYTPDAAIKKIMTDAVVLQYVRVLTDLEQFQ